MRQCKHGNQKDCCVTCLRQQLTEARAALHEDGITEPCGHARRWQAHRDGLDPHSATFCLFCELSDARALLREACEYEVWISHGERDYAMSADWRKRAAAAGGPDAST